MEPKSEGIGDDRLPAPIGEGAGEVITQSCAYMSASGSLTNSNE